MNIITHPVTYFILALVLIFLLFMRWGKKTYYQKTFIFVSVFPLMAFIYTLYSLANITQIQNFNTLLIIDEVALFVALILFYYARVFTYD